jgi:hypothetical protein
VNKDLNPETLKAKANELLKKAKEIEEKQFVRIGKLVYEYYQKAFEGFDVEKLKSEIKETLSTKKRGKRKAQ